MSKENNQKKRGVSNLSLFNTKNEINLLSFSRLSTTRSFPNEINIASINKLFEATEWIVKEAFDDKNSVLQTIEIRRSSTNSITKYAAQNKEDLRMLEIRLGSRIQAYINQICLIEDILTHECEYFNQEVLFFFSKDEIITHDHIKYKKKLKDIRKIRNKMTAHTCHTHPRKEDSPETRIGSILNLFPNALNFNYEYNGDIVTGNKYFNGFSERKSELPIIKLSNWENNIRKILIDWKDSYIQNVQNIMDKCPYKKEDKMSVNRKRLCSN
jgi:hypothetical protein